VGVCSQAVGFVLVRCRNASVAVMIFSHLIYFITKFYKCLTFNAIFKDNAAIKVAVAQAVQCLTTIG
jgi:hypothetical protein